MARRRENIGHINLFYVMGHLDNIIAQLQVWQKKYGDQYDNLRLQYYPKDDDPLMVMLVGDRKDD